MAGALANDRSLAAEIRRLGLRRLQKILADDYDNKEFQEQIMLRLAPALIPRLTEISGPDGKELPTPILYVPINNSDKKNISSVGAEEKNIGDSGRNIGEQNSVGTSLLSTLSPVGQIADIDEHSLGELPAP